MTLTAPRRAVRTFLRDGREIYADTGRPVDERLGSHVVLWIVEDPEAWASAIEAEGDAQVHLWPKARRHIGEHRRAQAYESAAQIRARGSGRTIYTHHHDPSTAESIAASLRRSHPNPGVRYEVAVILSAGACRYCQQPTILAAQQWWHHTGRYPVECTRRPEPEPAPEPERVDGEFEIAIGTGSMTCGYCNRTESWPEAVLRYAQLTGVHLLGVEKATNVLVVLAEATTMGGQTVGLPHHCLHIPEDLHQRYAPATILRRESRPGERR